MNVDLGFNVNSFQTKKGQSSLSQSNSGNKDENFKSQLKNVENKSVEAKSIGSKPIPESGGFSGVGPSIGGGFPQTRTVNEVIPTPKEASKIQEVASDNIDTLTRRVAWQQFLQKMDSDLGVSAEDILFAFQSLTAEELAQSPEKNVDKLVESLDLNPAQSQVAAQLFTDLLAKTGSRPLSQELVASQRDINLTVMSQREQDQRRLTETLDRMNQQFFMKDKPKDSTGVAAASGMEIPSDMTPVEGEEAATLNPFRVATPIKASVQDAPQMAVLSDSAPKTMDAPADQLAPVAKDLKTSSEEVAQQAPLQTPQAGAAPLAAGLQFFNTNKDSNVSEDSEGSFLSDAKDSAQKPVVSASSEIQKTTLEKDLSKDENSSEFETLSQKNIDPTAFKVDASSKNDFKSLMSDVAVDNGGQNQSMSTEDLIQKAQVMVRDGGGEVKVILQPEGLGEVAMRISVQGDKVNVEMITESDQAKKLLEKGMADLKGHLHASNLNLESIKVDTASNMGQQLEQQYHDAQRNQAQQFMEQFRQSNQEFRRNMFDMPGAKVYKGQTQDPNAQVAAATNARNKGERRLNLVA